MKVIKCGDCGSTNTEYGEYQLVAYRMTVLDDSAESAADYMNVLWDECRRDNLESEMEQHFMCNNCFATVSCSSPDAEKWKAVELKHTYTITETRTRKYEVEAESVDEAYDKVYNSEEEYVVDEHYFNEHS